MKAQGKGPLLIAILAALGVCGPAAGAGQERPGPGAQTQPSTQAVPVALAERERIISDGGATVARLDNGLTVVVKASRQAPVVCVEAYVRAGGLYEAQWLGTGISHLTEHLIARDAAGAPDGGQDKASSRPLDRVEEIGGQSNASTSLDFTCYYISAAAGKTGECIDLVADWMARPEITEEDFQREHGVVQRELETGKDNPLRQIAEAHAANFFGSHPAGVPVIGYAEPLRGLTRADVQAYHRKMYAPQNMILTVVGDVDVAVVLNRVRRAFAGFARGRDFLLPLPEVPRITGLRRVVRPHGTIKEVIQRMSFRTIPLVHDDLYALDVLSYVLTEGRASRLVEKIERQKKLVTSIDSSSWTPAWGAGMFTVSFRAETDKADQAEQAILEELESIAREGIKADQLERAKRQKIADFVYSQQTVESIAATLATDLLTTGDVDFSGHYTRRIQAVTADEVRQAARTYFKFDAMVITRLAPAPAKEAETRAATTQAASQPAGASMFRLPNGLRVVLGPSDAVGLVSVALVTQGGVLLEDEKTNGLGTLMAALATKGTPGRSAEQIASFFDRAGGNITGSCGNNTFYWQATVLDDSFAEALDVFADVVVRPTFPAEELDILRPVVQAQIKQQDEDWQGRLGKFFRGKFFADSPYRLLPTGRAEVVAGAGAQQTAEYHRKFVRAGDSVLAVYGKFDPVRARQRIEKVFADLPEGRTELAAGNVRKVAEGGERHTLNTEGQVAAIMVAAPGMRIRDLDDRLAIDVLDTIISGWSLPAGWLHDELRGEKLVYVVHAYNWTGLRPGAFQVYAACQPTKAKQVVEIIQKNLDKAASYAPSQKEIDTAVNSILTAELLDKQSVSSLALSAGLDELYGFGYDFRGKIEAYYRKVTPAEVLRVGRKYLGHGYVTAVTTPERPVE